MVNKPPTQTQGTRNPPEDEIPQMPANGVSMTESQAKIDQPEKQASFGATNIPPSDAKESIAKNTEKAAGFDEKQRDIKSTLRDPIEDWRDWLVMIAKKAGVADPIKHAKWIEENFRREDVYLSQKELEQMERDWPMSGEPIELLQKVSRESPAALTESASRWRRFAQTTLAATLRRMEERGDTPEEEMDVLVRALRPVRDRLRSTVGTLILAARARMARQSRQLDGYYATRVSLADTLSALKDEQSRRLRSYLYWEILRELQKLGEEQISAGVWARIVNSAANNLASVLDDMQQINSSVSCMKLAVAAGSAARMQGTDKQASEDAHSGLVKFFHEEAPVTPEWAALLDDMGNVPATWRHVEGQDASDLYMWLVELGAAIARAGLDELDESPRKVASSLFNAGVTVSRGVESGKRNSWCHPKECRIVLNGAGLLWVLSRGKGNTPSDFVAAIEQYQGGSCTVNLLGAVMELDRTPGVTESLAHFINVLHGLQEGFSGGHFSVIETTARKLKLKPLADTTDPVTALTDLLVQCLQQPDWKNLWLEFAKQPQAETLGTLLAHLGRQSHGQFDAALTLLATLLHEFEIQGHRWPNAFIDTELDSIHSEKHAEFETEWRSIEGQPNLPGLLASMSNELIHG